MASFDQLREQKLTVIEVARILRVSKMSVYRLLESGALRHYRVGPDRHYRIPISAVQEYLGGSGYELEGEEG